MTRLHQAIAGRRLNAFAVDPDNLIIIGLDTDDGPEHPLYDERVKLPLDESTVLNIMAIGVKEPVLVRKTDGNPEVVDGRRRTMHAREANRRLRELGEKTLIESR
jgi:ParB family chromosome partitioning protein